MNFEFSKELITIDTKTNPGKQLRLYKIFNNKGHLEGQLFYYPKAQTINFADKKISIEVISKIFNETKYLLIDQKDNSRVGEYKIFGGSGIQFFWKDVPSSPFGKLILSNKKEFNFRRVEPDGSDSLVQQKYWNHYKFIFYAVQVNECCEYSLKIDQLHYNKLSFIKYTPFSGLITSNFDNMFTILAGLYLLETALIEESIES